MLIDIYSDIDLYQSKFARMRINRFSNSERLLAFKLLYLH